MKLKRMIISMLIVLSLIPTVVFAQESVNYQAYDNLVNFILKAYIDDTLTKEDLLKNTLDNLIKDNPKMLEALYHATFESLDEYSEFYNAEELEKYVNAINNTFYGVGVVIQKKGEYITVSQCVKDGPAEKAGILPMDKIIAINNQSIVDWKIDDARELIIGERYTDVVLNILRGEEELSVVVTRDEFKMNTVYSSILSGNIGEIQITNFAESTTDEFKKALEEMDKNNITNIVLDLRNNPGGYLMSAVNIAQMIVPKGPIVTVIERNNESNMTYESSLENAKYKFAVLVNENTASASEVLAGAMVDSGVGVLFGDTTYGKGVVQDMYLLSGGNGMKLTIAHYVTRNGTEINGKGLSPDKITLNTKSPIDTSKYVAFDYLNKYQLSEQGSNVKAAEERLALMGYYVGTVDDIFTEDTYNAIYQFQQDNELYAYGVLDITTQIAINNVFYNLEQYTDIQFKEAYESLGGNAKDIGFE